MKRIFCWLNNWLFAAVILIYQPITWLLMLDWEKLMWYWFDWGIPRILTVSTTWCLHYWLWKLLVYVLTLKWLSAIFLWCWFFNLFRICYPWSVGLVIVFLWIYNIFSRYILPIKCIIILLLSYLSNSYVYIFRGLLASILCNGKLMA